MAFFPLKKIEQYAGSRQMYLRGVSCYSSGRVTQVTCAAQPPYAALWKAAVFNDERTQTFAVQAGFDQNGALCHTSCACSAGGTTNAVCRHVIALLVHKYYTDMLGSTVPALTVAPARTDVGAADLLQAYNVASACAEPMCLRAQIKLTPAPVLQLLLGQTHPVTVQDWVEFCQKTELRQSEGYGSIEPFVHCPEAFREQDRPLLQGLQALAQRRKACSAAAEQPLSDMEWELLLDWLTPCGFLLRDGSARLPVEIRQSDPVLALTVKQVDGGIMLHSQPFCILPGMCGISLLCEQTLYRCSHATTAQLLPFLQAMQRSGMQQFWATQDLPAFCDTVWLQIASAVSLQGDTAALLEHLPPTASPELYLDTPARGRLTLQAALRYGEQTLFLPSNRRDLRRNTRQEQQLLAQLQALFPLFDGSVFAVEGDDEQLDLFLDRVFPLLQQMGSVFVAQQGQFRPAVRPQPTVQVGVTLSSGLLDLSLQAEDWNTEQLLAVWSAYRQKRAFHRLKDGQLIDLRDGQLVELFDALQQAGLDERTVKRKLPSCRALLLQDRLDAGGIGWTADQAATELLQTIKQAANEQPELPPALEPILRDYQKQGVAFLQTLTRCGFGGILADDMGLGKTLQVLSLLQAQKGPATTAAALVVCPASLVLAWEHEAHKFTPDLRVKAVYGSVAQRRALLESDQPTDLLITSYDLLKRDLPWYQSRPLRAIILDEAQYIKNHATRNARAVKALQAPCRLALTGTPLENRLSELWSIFDFLMPGFLFSYRRFRERYEMPIVRQGDSEALQALQRHISPFVLRRTKEQVLHELPPKTQTVRYAIAQDDQLDLYRAQLLAARGKLEAGAGRVEVLSALTRLRQICCDPSLCYSDYSGHSAKLESCMQLLEEAVAGGHKVLLFSQFTSMLRLIADKLQQAGHRFYLLQGSTSTLRRTQMVQAFNGDDTPVMLVSLKAGGTGLNLTGADVVIHYDPWWNAAAMDQATDRAHRIGQTKPVQVYTLLLKNTLEEKILLLQQAKRRLAGQVVPEGGGLLDTISREQLLALLRDG